MITEETYGTEEAILNLTIKDGSDINLTADESGVLICIEELNHNTSYSKLTYKELDEMVDALIDFRRNVMEGGDND